MKIFLPDQVLDDKEVERLIENHQDVTSIFFAPTTLETIIHILALFKKGIPLCPISPRESSLPELSLPASICSCLATSGTTGAKFAMHSLENHLANARSTHRDLILQKEDGYLVSLPLYHIGGLSLLLRSFLADSNLVLPGGARERVTHSSFVPTQLKRFLEKKESYPNLRAILLGGAAIPLSLCEEAKDLPLYLTYGMTEMTSQVATKRFALEDGINFGYPLPGREVKIGVDGEVFVRGGTLFLGYYGLPSPLVDGWLPTRDLGCLDENGLTILGRKDRMLISGGENIYPEEIERAFLSLSEVESVVVSKRIDKEFGERPIAKVWIREASSSSLLYEKLERLLVKFKIPYAEDITVVEGSLEQRGSYQLSWKQGHE
ncbi:MAG: AMP-binding protein [Verrucomicrobia bacterium]|nr:AMP-binding protein [Verrucomicrobiota bacterium]